MIKPLGTRSVAQRLANSTVVVRIAVFHGSVGRVAGGSSVSEGHLLGHASEKHFVILEAIHGRVALGGNNRSM